MRWNLYRISIALTIRSFEGISIALAIHSFDPTLGLTKAGRISIALLNQSVDRTLRDCARKKRGFQESRDFYRTRYSLEGISIALVITRLRGFLSHSLSTRLRGFLSHSLSTRLISLFSR